MPESPVAADLGFMREVNTEAILERLRGTAQMHVAELAGSTGLSRQAVTRSLTRLRQMGLVEFLPPERSGKGSGRPAQPVRFRSEAGYTVGVFIDPHHIRIGLADLRGVIIKSSAQTLTPSVDGGAAVEQLVDHLGDLLEEAGIGVEEVCAAAVGSPGIVDPAEGVIRLVPSMSGLTGDVVVRALGDHLGCQVYLDNDINLAAQGEQWHGVRRDDSTLVVVHWGERIGAGVLLNGTLYRGATNDAGDLGFLDVVAEMDSPAVPGLGRFESWAGSTELVQLARQELEQAGAAERADALADTEDALEQVLAAIEGHDRACLAALQKLAKRFALGLGAVRALLDPHVVVLSGPMSRVGDVLLDALGRAQEEHPLELPELQVSTLGDDAVVHGAIRHCLNELEHSRYAPIRQRKPGVRIG